MISYNDVYEILRKEKYSEALQLLPKDFVREFSNYINDKIHESNKEDDMFQENIIKSKKQLENSVAMFKELMRLRKKKILNLVFVATETGLMKRDYENMLVHEREIFDRLVSAFEEGDKEVASVLIGRKSKTEEKNRMIMFNSDVEQFVDSSGKLVGPFTSGELANLDNDVAVLFVNSGKASFVDE
jgi:DNA replication initiation complex subunit (GINS family)